MLLADDDLERGGTSATLETVVDARPPAELLAPDADPAARFAFVMGR